MRQGNFQASYTQLYFVTHLSDCYQIEHDGLCTTVNPYQCFEKVGNTDPGCRFFPHLITWTRQGIKAHLWVIAIFVLSEFPSNPFVLPDPHWCYGNPAIFPIRCYASSPNATNGISARWPEQFDDVESCHIYCNIPLSITIAHLAQLGLCVRSCESWETNQIRA